MKVLASGYSMIEICLQSRESTEVWESRGEIVHV